jgi:hypothetical protein
MLDVVVFGKGPFLFFAGGREQGDPGKEKKFICEFLHFDFHFIET